MLMSSIHSLLCATDFYLVADAFDGLLPHPGKLRAEPEPPHPLPEPERHTNRLGETVREVEALVAHNLAALLLDQAEVSTLPVRLVRLLLEPTLERVRQVVVAEVNPLTESQYRIMI